MPVGKLYDYWQLQPASKATGSLTGSLADLDSQFSTILLFF
jgi:hypothetical protein